MKDTADSNRLSQELSFHNRRFGGDDADRRSAKKYYSINSHATSRFFELISHLCQGQHLLEYGCGRGNYTMHWPHYGARVSAIDISIEGIKQGMAIPCHGKIQFALMNAEETGFRSNSFDLIVGSSIIHHLNLPKCYAEMQRILKHDGNVVFMEPLGHNPLICLYRALTPTMRTKDEHPLMLEDIMLLKRYFHSVKVEYFNIVSLLAVPFRNLPIFSKLCRLLRRIDEILFRIRPIRKYAWLAIIWASEPRKMNPDAEESKW